MYKQSKLTVPTDADKVTQAGSAKNLYYLIKTEVINKRSVDDAFFFVENLICLMCPEASMCLDDDGTIEVFYGHDFDFMSGEFSDLIKCVNGPEFYELVEGEKDFSSDHVLGLIEKYVEFSYDFNI